MPLIHNTATKTGPSCSLQNQWDNMAQQIKKSYILSFISTVTGTVWFICEYFQEKEIIIHQEKTEYNQLKTNMNAQDIFVKRRGKKSQTTKPIDFPIATLFPLNFSLNELQCHDSKFSLNNSRVSSMQKPKFSSPWSVKK